MREERPGLRVAVAALQHRDFRLFYIALLAAALGAQIQTTANLWQVYELTGSALHLGLTGLARAVPVLALSLMGGVIADRVNRRTFIMITQAVTGMLAVVLALLTAGGLIQVWHIYLTVFLGGTLMAVNAPARTAMVPSLVPRHHLLNAIALQSTVWQVANVVGPAIAGLLIGVFGLGATYFLNGLAHVVTVGVLALVQVGALASRPRESPVKSLLEGIRFVRQESIILVLLVMDTAATLLGAYRALMPIFAIRLGAGSEGFGTLLSSSAVGAVLGAAAIMALGDVRYKGLFVIFGILGYCAALVLLGLAPWLPVALVAVALLGFFDSVQMLPRNTVIQAITPDHLRGRVSSFQSMLTGGAPSLGQATSGALATLVGAPLAVIVGAVSCAIVILGIAGTRPDLRERDLGAMKEPQTGR
ncbi:MAG: MFS transporter [Chloroflexi bacterium]|nr:MFS transporter [Chloroflexota bacterium]